MSTRQNKTKQNQLLCLDITKRSFLTSRVFLERYSHLCFRCLSMLLGGFFFK